MAPQRPKLIREWLGALGTMCNPTSTENAVAKVGLYAEALKDMPPGAFTDESCNAAAAHFEYFPAYAALRKWLELWWSANNPAKRIRADLPGAEDSTLTEVDRILIAGWLKNRESNFGHLAESRPEIPPHRRAAHCLSSLRSHHPNAAAYLVRTDAEAASIANPERWAEPS